MLELEEQEEQEQEHAEEEGNGSECEERAEKEMQAMRLLQCPRNHLSICLLKELLHSERLQTIRKQ
jgi:hypothetical protein